MAVCKKCAKDSADGLKYCVWCGEELEMAEKEYNFDFADQEENEVDAKNETKDEAETEKVEAETKAETKIVEAETVGVDKATKTKPAVVTGKKKKLTVLGVLFSVILALLLVQTLCVMYVSSVGVGVALSDADTYLTELAEAGKNVFFDLVQKLFNRHGGITVIIDETYCYSIQLLPNSLMYVKNAALAVFSVLLVCSVICYVIIVVAMYYALSKLRRGLVFSGIITSLCGLCFMAVSTIMLIVPKAFGLATSVFASQSVLLFDLIAPAVMALTGIILTIVGACGKKGE